MRKLHSSFVLGSTDAFTRITEGDWRAVADTLGIPAEQALVRLRGLLTQVPDAFEVSEQQVTEEAGLSERFDWRAALEGLRESSAFA
ncbi:MAG: hypothetical protein ACKOT0_07455 [bacterium]